MSIDLEQLQKRVEGDYPTQSMPRPDDNPTVTYLRNVLSVYRDDLKEALEEIRELRAKKEEPVKEEIRLDFPLHKKGSEIGYTFMMPGISLSSSKVYVELINGKWLMTQIDESVRYTGVGPTQVEAMLDLIRSRCGIAREEEPVNVDRYGGMITDQLREATEFPKPMSAGEIIAKFSTEDKWTPTQLREVARIMATPIHGAKACQLAQAYLAEHPADDEEPITEAWLRSVGFDDEHRLDWKNLVIKFCVPIRDNFWDFYLNSTQIKPPKTRGDVRRLCKALGVELKEANP